jgi:hypothetical protein
MAKPSDLPPEVQAAAIVTATQILLAPGPADIGTFKHIPSPKDIVKHAIDILMEYARHHDIDDAPQSSR